MMSKETKYTNFTTEDFVEDADFRKWISSPDEISATSWTNFIKNFPEKREAVELARQIVEAVVYEETTYQKEEFRNSLDFLKEYLSGKTKQRKRSLWLGRAAAILVLPLLMAVAYFYSNRVSNKDIPTIEHVVPDGEKSRVVLSDGTSVWLNSGSTLSYEANGKQIRKVRLAGEAFFNVAKDPGKPFLVETRNYTVKVYGTAFNVRAYDDLACSETVLKEGSVTIRMEGTKEVPLKPGQRFFLNKEKKYCLSYVNPDLYLNWKDNILKISNEPLEDLVIRMERWYGIKITVEDFERVKQVRYTMTIKTESLREMLELMNCVTPFSYEINGENVVLKYR